MPSVIHNGIRYIQTKHKIQCKRCLEIISSKSNHDFKYCSCRSVGIDGGIGGCNRIIGKREDYINKGEYIAMIEKQKIRLDPAIVDSLFTDK